VSGKAMRDRAVDRVAKVEIDPVVALLGEVVEEDGDARAGHFAAGAATAAAAKEGPAGGARDGLPEVLPLQ
jgi:hypothetical protein